MSNIYDDMKNLPTTKSETFDLIVKKKKLLSNCVGTLYPSILQDQITQLNNHFFSLPDDPNLPTTIAKWFDNLPPLTK